jgi:hypothetical protein
MPAEDDEVQAATDALARANEALVYGELHHIELRHKTFCAYY